MFMKITVLECLKTIQMIKNNVVKNSPNQVLVHATWVTSGGTQGVGKRALVRALATGSAAL